MSSRGPSRRRKADDGGDKGRRDGGARRTQQGIQPRYRRAFGCVTWIYMATLVYLAVASVGLMPVWFFAGWDVFSILEGITFYATVIFLPAMALAAVVGARTYRTERQVATRNGTSVGAVVGLIGFAFLLWLENVAAEGSEPGLFYWLVIPPVVASAALVLYAVFPGKLDRAQRRRLVLVSAVLVGFTSLALLAANFSLLQAMTAGLCVLSGAAGGWTAGVGYARAGGEEMLPPGVTEVRRAPRRKPR